MLTVLGGLAHSAIPVGPSPDVLGLGLRRGNDSYDA